MNKIARLITKSSFIFLMTGASAFAHQMFRDDPKDITTYSNSETFSLKNGYEFSAEYKIEIFDKEMIPLDGGEWKSNFKEHTIRMSSAAIKDIDLRFKPSADERKLYVCTKLTQGKDVEIELYSRICLRLVVKPSL